MPSGPGLGRVGGDLGPWGPGVRDLWGILPRLVRCLPEALGAEGR